MEREFVPVSIGVVMVSDAPSTLDEATGKLIVDRLTDAGHTVTPIEVVADSTDLVTAHLQKWIRDSQLDVVIALAGLETDCARAALTPLITKPLAGFSDLFRMLTYNEIGTGAMLTEVIAAQCNATYVFVLPASKGAVGTALEKILLPQLDHRTKPRNLVMRMARHRPNGAEDLESSGPKAFPKEEHTPFGVPPAPAPARANRQSSMPPPPPGKKRSPSVHSTPPMPLVAVAPAKSIADAELAELDPGAVLEESTSQHADSALEAAIEKSIEASGTPIESVETPPVTKPLDENDPAIVAAREHAQKSPEMQAAAWVAAVEQAASKVVKRAAAEREARVAAEEAARDEVREATPDIKPANEPDEVEAAEVIEEAPAPKAAAPEELDDEPRGKIEKATSGKPAPKPDHAIDNVAAVIVEDPDLIERASRSRLPSMKPATVVPLPPPRPVEFDLPVFPARATGDLVARPQPKKPGTSWVLFGGIAVIAAVVLLVFVIGKRNKSVAGNDPTHDPVGSIGTNPVDPPTPTPTPTPPPVDPTASDIEMDPTHRNSKLATVPQDPDTGSAKDPAVPKQPKDPAVPKQPKDPKDPKDPKVDPDNPDITKAPKNPVNTGENCDEVSCILDKFARPCCERYKPADTGSGSGEKKPPIAAGPVDLDKTLIRIGVERFRPQIIRCGEQATTKGTVKLSVVVRPDGTVDNVTVAESPDPALGACAAAVMRKATFAKTQNGGSFTYPFDFN